MKKSVTSKHSPIAIGFSKLITIWIILNTALGLSAIDLMGQLSSWYYCCLPIMFWLIWRAFTRHALRRGSKAIVQCQLLQSNIWRLTTATGDLHIVKIASPVCRSPWIMILFFTQIQDRSRLTLILTVDAVGKQNYRELLTRLWIGR